MMYFLIALLLGLLGVAPISLAEKYYESYRRKTPAEKRKVKLWTMFGAFLAYTLLGWWIMYAGMPTIAWPMYAMMSLIVFLWWMVSTGIAYVLENGEKWSHVTWFPIGFLFVLFCSALSGWGLFHASNYAELIGDINTKSPEHWSQEIQPLDPTKIRLVPEEVAISLARTALGDNGTTLGSQFLVDSIHVTLQKIKNQYWYLVPLDYKSWKVWTSDVVIPGYVKISATDAYAKPILVTGKKFKYTPDAFFGDNLERRLYWKYIDKTLVDYSFEEDDEGNVFWVVTVCHPSISFWGSIVDGVVIINPETGENNFVSMAEVNANPVYDWVDRVIPINLVKIYINEWGNFSGGWWNQAWAHANLLKAETPTLNYSADGTCVIVTPITSTNSSDGAMTGLMYTAARTGVSTYYAANGASESKLIEAVNSAVMYKKWHASTQIVYENIYGKLSALVPVIGLNGTAQGLAIVETQSKSVAVGVTPQEALINYQKILMSAGGQITTENIKNTMDYIGTITRLGWEVSSSDAGKQYYLYFKEFNNSFMVSSSLQSELSLTREGDLVSIKYIASSQASVPVMEFRNLTLNLTSSKNEQKVNSEMRERKQENQIEADVKDFKEGVKKMSDEEIRKLMDKK